MILDVEGCEGYDDTVVKGRYGLNTAGQGGNAMGDVRALNESFLIGFALGQSCEARKEGRQKGGKHTIPFDARKGCAPRIAKNSVCFKSGTSPRSVSCITLHPDHEAPA